MKKELRHIAFIPDGNRRWAKERGLPTFEGHLKGYDLAKDVAYACHERGIEEVSLWGFSTENWSRKKEEVDYLMELFARLLEKDLDAFMERDVRLRIVGRKEDLSIELRTAIEKAEKATKQNTGGRFNICFNYGGRAEITEGVREIVKAGLSPEEITEEMISSRLWSAGMLDIDLIVRTSGEQRLSGFMPWRGTYSELYFSDVHWPDFTEEELDKAIDVYQNRERRFGGDGIVAMATQSE